MGNEKTTRTISQQKLEDYINDNEEAGEMLNALGVLSDEEYAAGVHKLEDFRVKIENDTAFAETKAEELEETGSVQEVRDAEQMS